MEKIDYKKIVDKAIGEKPSLVKREQPEWLTDADIRSWGVAYNRLVEHFKNNPPNTEEQKK
jgi:hypothetical protein